MEVSERRYLKKILLLLRTIESSPMRDDDDDDDEEDCWHKLSVACRKHTVSSCTRHRRDATRRTALMFAYRTSVKLCCCCCCSGATRSNETNETIKSTTNGLPTSTANFDYQRAVHGTKRDTELTHTYRAGSPERCSAAVGTTLRFQLTSAATRKFRKSASHVGTKQAAERHFGLSRRQCDIRQ